MNIKKLLPILYIFALSLVPVFWAPKGMIFAGGDDSIFLNPACFFRTSAWNNNGFAANLNTDFPRAFPLATFWILFQKIGFSNELIERIWLFSMWATAGISMLLLVKTFFPKASKIMGLATATLYLLNPFNIFLPLSIAIRYVHSFSPLLLAIFAKGLFAKGSPPKVFYAALFGLSSLFSASAFANSANGMVILLIPFLFFLFYFCIHRKEVKTNFLYGTLCLVLFFLINLYWIWGFFYMGQVLSFVSTVNWGYFGTTGIFDLFRTLGGWAFGKADMMVFEHSYFQSLGIVIASFFVVFIAFLPLFRVSKDKFLAFFVLLTVVALFLAKGTLAPWGELYQFYFDKYTFLKVFREPWTKFTPIYILSLSVLFGYGLNLALEKLKRFKPKFVAFAFFFLTILMLLAQSYPAFFGVNFWRLNFPGQRSSLAKVPDYWKEMVNFFNDNDRDSVIFITPRTFSARDYLWESGISGLTPNEYIYLDNPLRYASFAFSTNDKVYNGNKWFGASFYASKSNSFVNFLGAHSIKYILQENDISWGAMGEGNYPPKTMEFAFENKEYLEKYRTFGKIDIYKIKDSFYKPIVSLSNKIVWVDGFHYGFFSTWEKAEKENFSLISNIRGLPYFKQDIFPEIFQVVLDKDGGIDKGEGDMAFKFEAKRSGIYRLFVNVTDTNELERLSFNYSLDGQKDKIAVLKFDKDEEIEKYLNNLKSNDLFRAYFLEEVILKEGEHTVSVQSDYFKQKGFGIFNFLTLNEVQDDFLSKESLPTSTIKKINDAHFEVSIQNGNKPYIINFAQDFDDKWELLLKEKGTLKKIDAPHFVVNGVVNGWIVTPDKIGGLSDYTLVIKFAPQNVLNRCFLVSVVTVLLSLGFIGWELIFRRRNL